MNSIIFSDPHLTDHVNEAYRWNLFAKLEAICATHNIDRVYCLGDTVDRKDNHSRFLINKLIENFSHIQSFCKVEIVILAGNHDAPTTGPYYWQFLNHLSIKYIKEPLLHNNIYLLPFTPDPAKVWAKLDFSQAKAIFMHETVEGSLIEDDRTISGYDLAKILPGNKLPVYSGDVHRPQVTGGVVYVGVPHPTKYSETWPNRVILIKNDDFTHPIDIWITTTRRAILDISSSEELSKLDYVQGDQLRIRYHLTGKNLSDWPNEQKLIRQWAETKGLFLASLEADLSGAGVQANTEKAQQLEIMKPEEVIKTFGADEKLSPDVIQMGIELINSL